MILAIDAKMDFIGEDKF